MTMGEIIKMLRINADMTQDDLGEKLGVEKSDIRKYEKGEVENIKRSTIKKMAELFNVSPCYIMGWEDAYNPNGKLTEEVSLIEEFQRQYGKDSVQLLQNFTELNAVGKVKALETISDLTELQKYTDQNDDCLR